MSTPARAVRLFARSSWRNARYVARALHQETVGGALLLGAAVIALAFANSPWGENYHQLRETYVGIDALHLRLSLGHWAADGLLAIFFLVAGIELKRELVDGDLSEPIKAAVPVAAAVGGVVVPALIYTAIVAAGGQGGLQGWAIPTATDIAFALAVLAVIGTHLPAALRSFLLTLAVVDDLIAITIIAIFYSTDLQLQWLALVLVPLALWRVLLQRGWTNPVLLAIPAVVAWALVHASGVHATVAGVLLGLLVPVMHHVSDDDEDSLAERLEHALRPISAGVAVPVFAFFAAGVTLTGGALGQTLTHPVVIGVVTALVIGKMIGVLGGTYLVHRFTRAELDEDLSWSDVLGLSFLAGIGFTVSLLIGELAFGMGSEADGDVKVAVLLGSALSAAAAAAVLRRRNAVYRRIIEAEEQDSDADGVPDVYSRG